MMQDPLNVGSPLEKEPDARDIHGAGGFSHGHREIGGSPGHKQPGKSGIACPKIQPYRSVLDTLAGIRKALGGEKTLEGYFENFLFIRGFCKDARKGLP